MTAQTITGQLLAVRPQPDTIAQIVYPTLAMVYLGTVSTTAELTPRINVYRENMLPWVGTIESIKSFSQAAVRGA